MDDAHATKGESKAILVGAILRSRPAEPTGDASNEDAATVAHRRATASAVLNAVLGAYAAQAAPFPVVDLQIRVAVPAVVSSEILREVVAANVGALGSRHHPSILGPDGASAMTDRPNLPAFLKAGGPASCRDAPVPAAHPRRVKGEVV